MKQKERRKRAKELLAAACVLTVWAAFLVCATLPPPVYAAIRQDEKDESLRVELPSSGEVRVENQRGGVSVEVWEESFVELSVTGAQLSPAPARRVARKRGATVARAASASPVRVEKSESLVTISVARTPGAASSRVDLRLRVPSRARLKIFTGEGEINLRGASAQMSAQSVSGDIRLALPAPPDADLTAHSLNGAVNVLEGIDAPAQPLKGQKFQTRMGAGNSVVRLFSGRGRIDISTLDATAAAESIPENDSSQERALPSSQQRTTTSSQERAPRSTQQRSSAQEPAARLHSTSQPRAGAVVNSQSGVPTTTSPNNVTTPEPLLSQRRPPVLTGAQRSASETASGTQAGDAPQEVDEDEVVRVETELVTLNVNVVERANGRGLNNLAQTDFRLYEDNAEQQIVHFESASAPFDLVLLIDLSGSTGKVTNLIRAAALRFVNATRAQDRIAVITFAGSANMVSTLTTDREALRSSIASMQPPNGDTRLYDAVGYAMDYLERDAANSRRRAIILLSDGLDSTLPNVTGTGSTLRYEDMRSRVQEFDGVLYSIWTSTEYEAFSPEDIQPETFELARKRMEEAADVGGGVFYDVERLEDLAGAYERVVADLGTVYSLSYKPTSRAHDGRWHAIRVALPHHPNAVARGKRGYFAK